MSTRPAFLPLVSAAGGIATFSIMDALMKSAAITGGVFAALLWRSVIGAALGVIVWRAGPGGPWPAPKRLALHAARSAVTCGMALGFFWGLVRVPMAVGMALSFIAPIIALFLAALLLGEAVTRRAIAASALGLAGVVVIGVGRMQAGFFGADALWGMAAILVSAVLYAANLVLQRHQAQLANPAEITFFQSLWMAIFLSAATLWPGMARIAMPPVAAWRDIASAAGLATVSLLMLSWGWARAPAHRLLPVEYSAFLWSAAMGWLWFGEAVSAATLLGAGLIVAGCWHGSRGGVAATRGEHIEQTAL